eukprot:scaffold641_cov490-Prasinococcus_capsulatus_cf.AAC.6
MTSSGEKGRSPVGGSRLDAAAANVRASSGGVDSRRPLWALRVIRSAVVASMTFEGSSAAGRPPPPGGPLLPLVCDLEPRWAPTCGPPGTDLVLEAGLPNHRCFRPPRRRFADPYARAPSALAYWQNLTSPRRRESAARFAVAGLA